MEGWAERGRQTDDPIYMHCCCYLPCVKHQFLMWLCSGLLGLHPRKRNTNSCERETKGAKYVVLEQELL